MLSPVREDYGLCCSLGEYGYIHFRGDMPVYYLVKK
jgi:hypothetical protein